VIVAGLSENMLWKEVNDKCRPIDTFAISSGLVETCLSFIESFGSVDAPNVFRQHIEHIFSDFMQPRLQSTVRYDQIYTESRYDPYISCILYVVNIYVQVLSTKTRRRGFTYSFILLRTSFSEFCTRA